MSGNVSGAASSSSSERIDQSIAAAEDIKKTASSQPKATTSLNPSGPLGGLSGARNPDSPHPASLGSAPRRTTLPPTARPLSVISERTESGSVYEMASLRSSLSSHYEAFEDAPELEAGVRDMVLSTLQHTPGVGATPGSNAGARANPHAHTRTNDGSGFGGPTMEDFGAMFASIIRTRQHLPGMSDVMTAFAQAFNSVKRAGNNVVEGGANILGNKYGEDRPVAGWSANVLNALVHEFATTGSATALRELAGGITEKLLNDYDVSPESKAAGVMVLYVVAAAVKAVSMMHKRGEGTSTTMSNVGDASQIASILGVLVVAGMTGRNEAGNGQFGTLSQLLPSALKSFVYTARDAMNLVVPLEGNHDAGYKHPVGTQAADSIPYFPNQLAVNTVQGMGSSGAGLVDDLEAGTTTLREGMKKVLGPYTMGNVAGESVDAIGLRAVNEVTTHGFTPKAAEELRNLRIKCSTIDTSDKSFQAQFADKMAGSASARLGLFLTVYGLSEIVSFYLGKSELSATAKANVENALGALFVIAGCLPFAMSTSTKEAPQPVTV